MIPHPADTHNDALILALSFDWHVPVQTEDIDQRWIDSFIALKFANVLAHRYYGTPLVTLKPADRAALKQYAEECVEGASELFGTPAGDPEYRPELEPEYDLEGRTPAETGGA